MNGKLAITFFSRTAVALLNFLIVLLTARYMGVSARGQIAIIMLGITFSQVVHQIIGGGIIYFAKKTRLQNLIIPTYFWSIVAAGLVTLLLLALKQMPIEFALHVFILSILQSLIATHLTLLLSFEKIKAQNVVMLAQAVLIALCLIINSVILNNNLVIDYIKALYVAYSFCFILSAYLLAKVKITHTNEFDLNALLIKSILKFGVVIQSTNVVQLLNYRLSYLLLNSYAGSAALGVFSTAVSLGESAWLFSKSLTNIQYPKIVHATDNRFKIDLTISYAKAALIGTLVLLLPLLLIPTTGYALLFGNDFTSLKSSIFILTPGLTAIGFTTLFAHYFSGIMQNRTNFFASAIGLMATLIIGYVLIPKYALTGACITTALSHLINGIFLIMVFMKTTKCSWVEIFPTKFSMKEILKSLR